MDKIPFEISNLPDKKLTAEKFNGFVETIAALRDSKNGCPWDLEQTHDSLRRYMIEEAYEATEALTEGDPAEICEELGDVLLQVVLNAQLASDDKKFSIIDVIESINNKMRRRHPHVFGSEKERTEREISQIKSKWKEIKEIEKAGKTASSEAGIFKKEKVEKVHPSTRQAYQIGKIANKINFDWDNPDQVFDKFISEVEELKEEWNKHKTVTKEISGHDRKRILDEMGDVYFTLAQLCRHLKEDPETIAWDGNKKFLNRFSKVEAIAKSKNIQIDRTDQKTLGELWLAAKALEKTES